ncbi:MAG: threonine dehydrogenase-like Zn-dependent dehydrogenase, partial [Pirellulaceae bacterium]
MDHQDFHHTFKNGMPMSHPAIAARSGSNQPHYVPDIEPPAPVDGQLVCRTLQLGVCGTDRDIISSASPLLPPGEDFLILGHECLAVVEQTTSGV